jgi:formiminoglutamase
MQILDHVHPPPVEVFYQRNDPNDQRLGETVQVDAAAYDSAHVVILGCPQDEGVRRNKGRLGSAHAPDAIRGALYRLVALENTELILFDAGNTKIQDDLEDTHALHASLVQQIIRDGKRVITLGGGNDVSYPDCYGLVQAGHTVMAINVDAHFDVRADAIRNSGTPYRQLLEEGLVLPQNFYEIASVPMSNSAVYRAYLLEKGAHIIDLFAVQQRGIAAVLDGILSRDSEAIFWGLDMDVVRAADAPGVSAPNALGLTGMEFCQVAARAGADPRSRVFEITEVNPTYDIDSRTSRLAAAAIHQFLANITLE